MDPKITADLFESIVHFTDDFTKMRLQLVNRDFFRIVNKNCTNLMTQIRRSILVSGTVSYFTAVGFNYDFIRAAIQNYDPVAEIALLIQHDIDMDSIIDILYEHGLSAYDFAAKLIQDQHWDCVDHIYRGWISR